MSTPQNNQKAIVLNGNLHTQLSTAFFLKNRALRLGDGFFETVRVIHGKVHLWPAHYKRITACARMLDMEVPAIFSEDFIAQSISNLLLQNEIYGGGRLRFTFFREGEGTYKPTTNRLGYILEANALHQLAFQLNDRGMSVDIYSEFKKEPNKFTRFKLLGNHLSVQAANWAESKNVDDALLLNSKGNIIEATASNLFIVKNGELHTPAIDEGCVGGIMRMAVINAAIRSGVSVYESELKANDVTFADEVFLTNSIRGIAWIGRFGNKRYYHKLSDILLQEISTSNPVVN